MSEVCCAIVAGSTHMQLVRNTAESSRVCKPKHDSQMLPVPAASPLRDDLFIDDTNDVDLNDRYVALL